MIQKYIKNYTFESIDSNEKICHLVVLSKFNIVVATELYAPISNDIERLIENVCARFSLLKERLIFIAHYYKCPYTIKLHEEAQLITFNLSKEQVYNRNSMYLSKNELKAIKTLVKIETNFDFPN